MTERCRKCWGTWVGGTCVCSRWPRGRWCDRRCGRRNNTASTDDHALIPTTCEDIALRDQRSFADVITVRMLRWADYLGLSGWAQCNQRSPYKWKREAGGRSQSDVAWERCNWTLLALKTEEGAMTQGIQGVSRSWKRPGNRFSPTASVQNEQLCRCLDFSPRRPISDSWLPELSDNKCVLL